MSAYENYAREATQIETEILRHGVALGIDWENKEQVRALAREALACKAVQGQPGCDADDPETLAKVSLFGLAQLMLTVMRESANENIHTHGGPVWKAFGRALWEVSGRPD